MYSNGTPTMYYADTTQPVSEPLAVKALQFLGFLGALGMAHEATEGDYWGMKDDEGNWLLKVEDHGHGEGHWYVGDPSDEALVQTPEPATAS